MARLGFAALLLPAVVGLLVLLVVPARRSAAGAAVPPTPSTAAPFAARLAWLGDCATCHAANAAGTPYGPDLRRASGSLLDYELSTGRMPLPYGERVPRRAVPQYTRTQMNELIAYVLSLTDAPANTIPPVATDLTNADRASGGEVFRLNCAACHTVTGIGGALLYRDAPPLRSSTPLQTAEAVREGPGAMPAFGNAAISDRDLRDVVAYVSYLRKPRDEGGWPIGHVGPIAEGLIGFAVGTLGLLVAARMIGTRT